jgi:uncharacterized protein (DUF2235 family)
MGRNIVICCDGTNNQFGPENTNVVRVAQVLVRDPSQQHLYYDPGLGTLPEPGTWTAAAKRISEIYGVAFGRGLTWKVGEAYSFLMDHWEPGDQVFVFGFSRGAYTARVLAGVLHALGLLPRGNYNLVPYVLRLFKALRTGAKNGQPERVSEYRHLCDQLRWSFARMVPEDPQERRFHVHFLGLWDTVSSVGWVWDPAAFPYTAHNPSVRVIRHAVSLDERRAFFRQNRMYPVDTGQDLKEVWFPGVHADVGGGYPEQSGGLWRMSFTWILREAEVAGLLVDPERLAQVLSVSPQSGRPWTDAQHESLKGWWWPAEYFPKLRHSRDSSWRLPTFNRGRHRTIQEGALLHESVLRRLRDLPSYRPPNISATFTAAVLALADVAETIAYRAGTDRRPSGD